MPSKKNPGAALAEVAAKENIRFFLFNFTDLFGTQRSKLVPASAVASVGKDGAGFASFAAHFDASPADPDLIAIPDPSTLVRLPWKPEVAWVACDLFLGGEVFEQSPRRVLQKQIDRAAAMGYELKTGVEVEFMLLEEPDVPGGTPKIDARDTAAKPCYEQSALMRRYAFLSELFGYMEALGWEPYQGDHEDASAQFELNWKYAPCMATADRVAFHKFMVKSVAERHALRATFMPKPFANKTGNGMHCHFTLHDKGSGKNVFDADHGGGPGDEFNLSPTALHFLGGILSHVQALTALTNPTVNSYKRLGAPAPDSGATWAPTLASHGGNDRTHVVRVPDAPRFELRLADMAANPYLLPAAILAAGLDGLESKADPGPRATVPAWNLPKGAAEPLPTNLLDALRRLEDDEPLREALGTAFCDAYLSLRHRQWQEYMGHLTQWELDNYFEG